MYKIDDQIFLGLVTRGDGRGRELGFPTANIDLSEALHINRELLTALISGNEHIDLSVSNDLSTIGADEYFSGSAENIFFYAHNLIRQLINMAKIEGMDEDCLSRNVFNYFLETRNKLIDRASINPDSTKFSTELDLPDDGVYAGRAYCETDEIWPCAVSLGTREQFYDSGVRLLEVHLIGFTGNIYNRLFLLQITHFLRAQQKFSSLEELILQIQNDVLAVRQIPKTI